MTHRASRPQKPRVPASIPLPELELLPNGCMFVRLKSLEELKAFWHAHRDSRPYSVEGWLTDEDAQLLGECEWVFGPDKASVVATICRWGQSRMHVAWGQSRNGTTGRWVQKGLLPGERHALWVGFHDEDITNPDLGIENVTREFQKRIFYTWSTPEFYDITAYEPGELDCYIAELEREQATVLSNSPW